MTEKYRVFAIYGSSILVAFLDYFAPANIAPSLIYSLPLVLSSFYLNFKSVLRVATLSTALIMLVFLFDREESGVFRDLFVNRLMAVVVIWLIAFLIQKMFKHFLSLNTVGHLIQKSTFLESAINSFSEGLVVCNEEGRFLYFNQATQSILGIGRTDGSKEEWSNTYGIFRENKQDICPTNDLPLIKALQGETIREQLLFIKNHEKPNGVMVSVTASPIIENGRLAGAIAKIRDITDELKMKERLLLSQKTEAMSILAGGIAHDFNNKLAAIALTSGNIREKLKMHIDCSSDIDQIEDCVRICSELTRQILAFSRKQTFSPKVISLREFIKPNFELYKKLLGQDIQVELNLRADADKMSVDPRQLAQVMLSLLINAKEAIGGPGKITVESENRRFPLNYNLPDENCVVLSVSDNGRGISEEVKDKIFDMYFSTKRRGTGLGLGLSAVHGIIKQCNGEIQVESEVGIGTTFRLFFPLKKI